MENQNENTGPVAKSEGMDAKTIAIIAYLTLIGFIIALVINNGDKKPFASFHIRQMLGLAACGLGMYVLIFIPVIGWILYPIVALFLFVLWIIGFLGAINGKETLVPVLGERFQEWFKGV